MERASFTYTPDAGFSGFDFFSYRVHHVGQGDTTTTELTVLEPDPPVDP